MGIPCSRLRKQFKANDDSTRLCSNIIQTHNSNWHCLNPSESFDMKRNTIDSKKYEDLDFFVRYLKICDYFKLKLIYFKFYI